MNPISLVMVGVGALMIWAGITDNDPITVIKDTLTGKGPTSPNAGPDGGRYGSADAAERHVKPGSDNNYPGGFFIPGMSGVNGYSYSGPR